MNFVPAPLNSPERRQALQPHLPYHPTECYLKWQGGEMIVSYKGYAERPKNGATTVQRRRCAVFMRWSLLWGLPHKDPFFPAKPLAWYRRGA